MGEDAQKSPCQVIWDFLDRLPDTIRENFILTVPLHACPPESVGPDWDYETEAHDYLHPMNSRDDATRAAIAIGLLELHFARPGMPSDEPPRFSRRLVGLSHATIASSSDCA